MMRTIGVLLTLLALALFLGISASAVLAATRGELDRALQTFAPLLSLPIGFLIYGLISSLRQSREPPTRFFH
jgi:ABC-type tungstate transport system substrate-binding protein